MLMTYITKPKKQAESKQFTRSTYIPE